MHVLNRGRRQRRLTRWLVPAAAAALTVTSLAPVGVEAANNVTVPEIQGAGHISPLVGQQVRVRGVVTAKAFNGFYLQDPSGDGDDATSDGIFVSNFRGDYDPDDFEIGQRVKVDGRVSEFIPGGPATGNLSITQIIEASVKPNNGKAKGQGEVTPVLIGEGGRIAPNEVVISDDELPVNLQNVPGAFDPANDAIDFYESLEGMVVTVDAPVVVGPTRRFSAFSAELFALPSGGSAAIIEPDDARTGRGGILLQPDPQNEGDQNPERIQIQFDPTVSGGASVPLAPVGTELNDVTGVVGYSFGNFEVIATHQVTFSGDGPAPETTSLAGSDTELTVASYNVLNLDPGDGTQFDVVAGHIADNMRGPDIVALQEIQDNNGTVDDGVVAADQTLQMLVDRIAAAGGPTYEAVDHAPAFPNEFGGAPGGNIRNAFLWNPDRVDLTDLESLDVPAFPIGSRDPLVGTFSFNGTDVVVVNNHFTSRFGSTPVFGGPQPFVQAGEADREAQAKAVNDYVDGLLADDPTASVIVTGDLNTFEWTDELTEDLPGVGDERVLTNLALANLDPSDADDLYTFIFDGNSQALDHMFVTDDLLAADATLDIVHVNVDYPRPLGDAGVGSDHEPMVAVFDIAPPFALQVLHASDLEGGVDALDRAANFAAIVDALEASTAADASITLSAGDNYIPGPFFSASGDQAAFRDSGLFNAVYNEHFGVTSYNALREGGGRVDVSIMNIVGFDASAVGNHEFDLGSDVFESIIEEDFRSPAGPAGDRWVGAQFPYLSSNLDFSGDSDLGDRFTSDLLPASAFATGPTDSAGAPKIAPYTIVDADGTSIGVVGATTPLLESISSPGAAVIGPNTNDMPALAAVVQPAIDVVLAAGVDKVVLVSHLQQISLEAELIPLLSGVDISIAGGSDTLLANPDDPLRAGDSADDQYPLITQNADGDPAVIVSTDGEYSYVGQLNVRFDFAGRLVDDAGGALTALDQLDLSANGPVKTEEAEVSAAWSGLGDPFATGTKGELVDRLVEAARGVVIAKDGNLVGETSVFLDGRRANVRTQETNLGNLGADANLAVAQAYDTTVAVSLKNGGGLRAEIGEIVNDGSTTTFLPPSENPLVPGDKDGDVSQLDIENSLRFNNGLTLITLTAAQLDQVIEHAVAATGPGNTPGQFPQVGGMRFSFDPSQPAGSRVQSLAIVDGTGAIVDTVVAGGAVQGDPNRPIRMVALNFLVNNGGDNYPFPAFVAANAAFADVVQLPAVLSDAGAFTFAAPGTEQDALAEYFAANHAIGAGTPFDDAETAPSADERIQNLSVRSDTVLS